MLPAGQPHNMRRRGLLIATVGAAPWKAAQAFVVPAAGSLVESRRVLGRVASPKLMQPSRAQMARIIMRSGATMAGSVSSVAQEEAEVVVIGSGIAG